MVELQTREMMLQELARAWINWFRSIEDGIVFPDPREWPSKETAEAYGLERAQLARLCFPGVLEYVGAWRRLDRLPLAHVPWLPSSDAGPSRLRDGAWSLERWAGLRFVGRHPGIREDFDIGWSFAAPVGQGGFPDNWLAGWMPIPSGPASAPAAENSDG